MMKRTGFIFVWVLFLLSSLVSAHAFGVTPAKIVADTTADFKHDYSFTIMNTEHQDLDLTIYVRGEWQSYVNLSNSSIHLSPTDDQATISYSVDIPFAVLQPGANTVEIVTAQSSSSVQPQGTTIFGEVAIVHQLVINVPIPGQYMTATFTTNDPETNDLELTYAFTNEGSETVTPSADVQIINQNGDTIATYHTDYDPLGPGIERKETKSILLSVPPGEYVALTTIIYGDKTIDLHSSFTVGGKFIEIESISSPQFILGRINRMDVNVYNHWSDQIDSVSATIVVKDTASNVYGNFQTLPVDVPSLSSATLTGYWDTTNLQPGAYNLFATLNYNGKASENTFSMQVNPDTLSVTKGNINGNAVTGTNQGFGSSLSLLIIAVAVLVIVNIFLIFYLRRGPPKSPSMPPQQPEYQPSNVS